MISQVKSAACFGLDAFRVDIEADISLGLPKFYIVGLPDPSIKESRERVRPAIKNSGFHFPAQKITINLAPADRRKEGPAFDLPMALGILAAQDLIPKTHLDSFFFLGELALDGSVRPIRGAVTIICGLKNQGPFIVPYENAMEAAFVQDAVIYPVRHLRDVVDFLNGEKNLTRLEKTADSIPQPSMFDQVDFSEVRGQPMAKRALEIAVAGGHNVLLIGPPGSGKTMLAKRVASILPPLVFEESLEITKIYSVAGLLLNGGGLVTERPFRSPHHSISSVALTGGGPYPKPGEISLAHHGVLFLDEFPEFKRDVLEALRGPLEDGTISISRVKMQVTYPANILLIAAMNPCPCGYLSDRHKTCRCSLGQIHKYQSRVSGPILDRLDLHVEVAAVGLDSLAKDYPEEDSKTIRERIMLCREIQWKRYQNRSFKTNACMRARDLREFAKPDTAGHKLIEAAMQQLGLSARAYFKILKIARTIADLAREELVSAKHIAEAIQYRNLDRRLI